MIVETTQGAFSFADDDPTPVPGQNWIVDGVDFGRVSRITLPAAHKIREASYPDIFEDSYETTEARP